METELRVPSLGVAATRGQSLSAEGLAPVPARRDREGRTAGVARGVWEVAPLSPLMAGREAQRARVLSQTEKAAGREKGDQPHHVWLPEPVRCRLGAEHRCSGRSSW